MSLFYIEAESYQLNKQYFIGNIFNMLFLFKQVLRTSNMLIKLYVKGINIILANII